MADQARGIDETSREKADDKHLVHRGLQNRPRSMNETQGESPTDCLLDDSSLVYGIRRDSLRHRHGRTCSGYPRLSIRAIPKTWMPATGAGMTTIGTSLRGAKA